MTKSTHKTILGFDFGKKYIGVAVGQAITGTASPLGSVKAKDGIPNQQQLKSYFDEWQPDLIVVGLPLNMDGTPQQVTFDAKKFGNRLAHDYKTPIEFVDERLTTADAKQHLFEHGGYRNLSKDNIDAESARLIVESYFESTYGE
ncbi:Holliday junction resolvase RuvX [Thalassotalea sp. 1_MG-2023]|uniref:Holliday junction resolvase RuvX n=1 Tax=Thalassotalea sp. 1_MG-2023 TaxID=3062680 RepID=UPI0026E2568C|nr:Holliday junction resolvase RuvX [Thalassotalea sp. 1_MG-2023]MDO6426786.1 Holliday junction resolvase RuvX [Thalassotalea sp. 1_MG-2023]